MQIHKKIISYDFHVTKITLCSNSISELYHSKGLINNRCKGNINYLTRNIMIVSYSVYLGTTLIASMFYSNEFTYHLNCVRSIQGCNKVRP